MDDTKKKQIIIIVTILLFLILTSAFVYYFFGRDTSTSESVTPGPTVSFVARPSTVLPGERAKLIWSSDAESCTASGDEASWFYIADPADGSTDTIKLSTDQTYSITCTSPAGTTVKSITVSVIQAETTATTTDTTNEEFDTVEEPFPTMPVIQAKIECVDLKSNLKINDRGVNVSTLQKFLSRQNLFLVAQNGYFGPKTLASVKNFQSSQKISTTGIVDPATRASIKSISCTGGSCTSSASCLVGQACSSGGKCISKNGACGTSADCPSGQSCPVGGGVCSSGTGVGIDGGSGSTGGTGVNIGGASANTPADLTDPSYTPKVVLSIAPAEQKNAEGELIYTTSSVVVQPNSTTTIRWRAFNTTGCSVWSDVATTTVTTKLASVATTTTLRGFVNGNGTKTSAWFEWGTTSFPGTKTASKPYGIGSSSYSATTTANTGTTYYYRAVASTTKNKVFGDIYSFKRGTGGFNKIEAETPTDAVWPSSVFVKNAPIPPYSHSTFFPFPRDLYPYFLATTTATTTIGTTTSKPITDPTTISITCKGAGGSTTRSLKIDVIPPLLAKSTDTSTPPGPTISLFTVKVGATTVDREFSATINWKVVAPKVAGQTITVAKCFVPSKPLRVTKIASDSSLSSTSGWDTSDSNLSTTTGNKPTSIYVSTVDYPTTAITYTIICETDKGGITSRSITKIIDKLSQVAFVPLINAEAQRVEDENRSFDRYDIKSFTAAPAVVLNGTSSTLSWTKSARVSGCEVSRTSPNEKTTLLISNTSLPVTPFLGTNLYTLTCYDSQSANKVSTTTTATAKNPPVIKDFLAYSINSLSRVGIKWVADGANTDSCSMYTDGAFISGGISPFTSAPYSTSVTNYNRLECTGTGITVRKTIKTYPSETAYCPATEAKLVDYYPATFFPGTTTGGSCPTAGAGCTTVAGWYLTPPTCNITEIWHEWHNILRENHCHDYLTDVYATPTKSVCASDAYIP